MSLKEVAAMKSMLASTAVLVTFCAAPAISAEFPKTGEAEYDTFYVDNVVAKIDSEAGTGGIVEETGITRNVKGGGPFHDMSVRCLYHWSLVEGTRHSNGSCVHTDKDGDNIFATFDDKTTYLMGDRLIRKRTSDKVECPRIALGAPIARCSKYKAGVAAVV
jgi:hypothetical protein